MAGAPGLEPPVEVARLERGTGPRREHQAGVDPARDGGRLGLGLSLLAPAQGGHADARQGQRGVGCLGRVHSAGRGPTELITFILAFVSRS